MKSKQYIFNFEELVLLREALCEYKHFITPAADEPVSEKRKRITALATAMHDQFKNDVRLFLEN